MSDQPLTVSEVTQAIKQTLESFPPMWIVGELTSFTQHSSGHRYFTLSDKNCQLRCVMWRSRSLGNFHPESGMEVLVQGQLTLYERRGDYQLNAMQMFPAGMGQQQLAFEQLKRKLAEEGLFDEGLKQPLPEYPRVIGVVTSKTAAAFQDILNVLKRRFSGVRIVLRPALVQGIGAAEDIAQGIADLNAYGDIDVMIVGRGGGAAEDLAAFNDERVVRAVAHSAIPVISAVGHEVDISLCDLAADLRAPTPSAAAEIVVRDALDLREQVGRWTLRVRDAMLRLLRENEDLLDHYTESYGMRRMADQVFQHMQQIDDLHRELEVHMRRTYDAQLADYRQLTGKLASLSPLSVLARGYSLTQRVEGGAVVQDANTLQVDDSLRIRFAKGEAICRVEEVQAESEA
ncbi:MAG: exodeoxyribonuclease VII large subunit [Candidatus Latescibacteria bacterium]|jgi:exodeoxyribonuclease VII large subunit|nr:exodeoxyribonuclease VII large subunit [Candidatus Latescibacterota bacterium]MBT5829398.1 exodeoxyribonuclease VII large subunit [Candidatus Latescibacterota bacterium]